MALGLWLVAGWMLAVAISGVIFLIWAWKHDQFRGIEDAKYSMLEDKDPEPWP